MLSYLRDKLSSIIGHEAERQNAIGRFGTGMAIDNDGNVADPRNPEKRIHVDDFSKLNVNDRFKAIAPMLQSPSAPQLQPEDITAKKAMELIKSSFSSDDALGLKMREERAATLSSGAFMSSLLSEKAQEKPGMKPKMV